MNWKQELITEAQIAAITRPFVLRQSLKDLIPQQKQADQYDAQISWLYSQVKKLNKEQGSRIISLIKKRKTLQAVQLMIEYGIPLSQEKLRALKNK